MEIPRRTFLFAVAPVVVLGCSAPMQTSGAPVGRAPAVDARASSRDFPQIAALTGVPDRTAITITQTSTGATYGTANRDESRPALSLTKLFLVDYALRFGSGSAAERELCERMVRESDNVAADEVDATYPMAIDAIAQEFDLPATARRNYWGDSVTSTADLVRFLETTKQRNRSSEVLVWMEQPAAVMAEGVPQDFGTVRIRNSIGTKWAISNDHAIAASASYGCDFSVAAITFGSTDEHTADVVDAFPAAQCDKPHEPAAK